MAFAPECTTSKRMFPVLAELLTAEVKPGAAVQRDLPGAHKFRGKLVFGF
jgi:hypothetical protein